MKLDCVKEEKRGKREILEPNIFKLSSWRKDVKEVHEKQGKKIGRVEEEERLRTEYTKEDALKYASN